MAHEGWEVPSFSSEDPSIFRLGARVACGTDVGRRRRNNEDNYLVLPLGYNGGPPGGKLELIGIEKGRLLVAVADGMGGHFGGEVASRLCVENLAKEIVSQLQATRNGQLDLLASLRRAAEDSHRDLFAHAQGSAEKLVMGTTLTAVLLHGARAEVAQVGDSRAYLLRNGNLILLTRDQTIGAQLRSRGEDSSKVDTQIQDMLTQAIGAQQDIEIVMTAVDLEPEDYILLCSDGLYKVVPPADIVQIIELETGLQEKATQLIARANEGGGPDNITVILTEICQVESAD